MMENRPTNHTPTIALTVAGILVLIVGGMSYRDYVKRSVQKEFEEREKQLMAQAGYVQVGGQTFVAPGTPQTPAGGQTQVQQQQNPNQTQQQQPGSQTQQQPDNQQGAQAQPNPSLLPSETNLPEPDDPQISRYENSLERAKQQAAATEERIRKMADEGGSSTTGNAEEVTEELPEFLRNALNEPPGGNPDVEERVARLKKQVALAPALATVLAYDKEWGIVTFNAGQSQGVKEDQRYAVRRGDDILGWIRVAEVQENQAVGILVTKNRDSDTARKPDVGDDLISFELY